jgi:hypothetical protein
MFQIDIESGDNNDMSQHATLPSMHVQNLWVDIGVDADGIGRTVIWSDRADEARIVVRQYLHSHTDGDSCISQCACGKNSCADR